LVNKPNSWDGRDPLVPIMIISLANTAEAFVRVAVIAVAAVIGLMALPAPAQAAPAALQDLGFGTPAIQFVRGGCGAGWHPEARRDRWGNWRRRCVPNRW
jgi:hypothetical protein